MDQKQAHGALFAEAGLDHAIVERGYRERMDDFVLQLEQHYPIDPGHGLDPIEGRTGLTDLLTRLHPCSAEGAALGEVAVEVRKNLWRLAYGGEG